VSLHNHSTKVLSISHQSSYDRLIHIGNRFFFTPWHSHMNLLQLSPPDDFHISRVRISPYCKSTNNTLPNRPRHGYFLSWKYYVLIMTTSINTLTISYHVHISLLIHSFTFQFQSQISQEFHNHQYYSISIINHFFLSNPQIALQKNQTIKIEKKFLPWARIS